MSICGTCGTETKWTRSVWSKDGQRLPDECPACAPQSFEKLAMPSDKKIWIGPEVRPNDYEKRYDGDGVYYMPKPEVTAEHERNLFVNTDEKEAHARAVAKKRREGRKDPLTPQEVEEALRRADAMVRPMIEDKETTHIV